MFSTYSSHKGNSGVLVLECSDGRVFVAVRQCQSLNLQNDPCRRYPALRTKVWSAKLHDTLDIVGKETMKDQYASWTDPKMDTTVIMSLSRVMPFLIRCSKYSSFRIIS